MAEGFTAFRTEIEDALANKSSDYSDLVDKLAKITNKVLCSVQHHTAFYIKK